jgi:hypothetical protein
MQEYVIILWAEDPSNREVKIVSRDCMFDFVQDKFDKFVDNENEEQEKFIIYELGKCIIDRT